MSFAKSRRPTQSPWQRGMLCAGFSIALALFASVGLLACQVPVFRYALERWSPDRYQVMVLSRGKLSDSDQQLLKPLKDSDAGSKRALVDLSMVDLSETADPEMLKLYQSSSADSNQPMLVAIYPGRSSLRKQVAWTSPLSQDSINALIDSPARQELIRRLTSGDSAVWLFLESGENEKDQAAFEALEKQLQVDAKRLALPSAEEMEISQAILDQAKIRLKISFSVLRIKRDDPKERFLIDCLLRSEPDLCEYQDEPIVFPVFGRGIVLYAIVGKGISAQVISSASSFIVGPCSCQVKEQNPGFDLLLSCDWAEAVGDTLVSLPIGTVETEPKLRPIPPGKKK